MGAVQLGHIKAYILNTFSDILDLSDIPEGRDKEPYVLTRGLAATALQLTENISAEEAAITITDGFDDCGIDAIYNDVDKKEIIFVQSKWSNEGNKTIDQGETLKFISGLRKIIKQNLEGFNDKIKKREKDIKDFLLIPNYVAKIIVAHVSNEAIPDYSISEIDSFLKEMNDTSDLFSFLEVNQRVLHRFVRNEGEQEIDIEIDLYDFGFSDEGQKVFYGKVSADALADWKEGNATALFDKNIRTFLGDTTINNAIVESLKLEPENFLLLNNGVTIICTSISDYAVGAGQRKHKHISCSGVQIVNGAQTVGACHKVKYIENIDISAAYVMTKIIEVGEQDELGSIITRATNTQNKIERKDFVSLDDVQKNLRISFSLLGIDYFIKSGESQKSKVDSLSLEEATHALIVERQDVDQAALAKREIGKIWEKLDGKNYTSLFNHNTDAKHLWKLVKLTRKISPFIEKAASAYGGRGTGYSVHGNIFIAMQIYSRLDLRQYFDDDYDEDEFEKTLALVTKKVLGAVYYIGEKDYEGSYLAHLFRNAGKCKAIALKIDETINDMCKGSP